MNRRAFESGGNPALQTLARNPKPQDKVKDKVKEKVERRFMESLNDSSIMHWDHEPHRTRVKRRTSNFQLPTSK
jgi:hypothetical protein